VSPKPLPFPRCVTAKTPTLLPTSLKKSDSRRRPCTKSVNFSKLVSTNFASFFNRSLSLSSTQTIPLISKREAVRYIEFILVARRWFGHSVPSQDSLVSESNSFSDTNVSGIVSFTLSELQYGTESQHVFSPSAAKGWRIETTLLLLLLLMAGAVDACASRLRV